jgi:sulfur-oxidizing protein SoxX
MLCLGLAAAPGTGLAGGELVRFRIVGGNAIPEPLTGGPGDAERGRQIAVDRALGNCVACHAMPVDAPLQGNVGPDLKGVGSRLTQGELRLRVVDPKTLNAQSAMPAYYRVDGLHRVRKDLQGRPILDARQIEDVVAYLTTLKE